MCMITFVPSGVDIPWVGLENGCKNNDDGHGWAVARGDDLLVGKSMDWSEALAGMEEARDALGSQSLVLFHSRLATHGTYGLFNVHPFYASPTTVVAHNGILPPQWWPDGKDPRSDTRKFADSLGKVVDTPLGVPSRRGARALANQIGSGNKLVFLSVTGGKAKARIVRAHEGVFTDGVWFSNHGFERCYVTGWAGAYRSSVGALTTAPSWPEGKCSLCGSMAVSRSNECLTCLTCLDCMEAIADCLCYYAKSDPKAEPQACIKCGSTSTDSAANTLEGGVDLYWCEVCDHVWDSSDPNFGTVPLVTPVGLIESGK